MRFDKKKLERWIDTELSLLRYYGFWQDRWNLTIEDDIYGSLKPIEYCKRQIPLYDRCSSVLITSKIDITPSSNIDDLYVTFEKRSTNTFTPVEVFVILFPDRKSEIISILQSRETNPSTIILI